MEASGPELLGEKHGREDYKRHASPSRGSLALREVERNIVRSITNLTYCTTFLSHKKI